MASMSRGYLPLIWARSAQRGSRGSTPWPLTGHVMVTLLIIAGHSAPVGVTNVSDVTPQPTVTTALDRRRFLGAVGGVAGLAALAQVPATRADGRPRSDHPFTLGV